MMTLFFEYYLSILKIIIVIHSRDKTHLKEIIIEKHINILLQCANLVEDALCIVITTENTDGKSPKMSILLTKSYNCYSKIY